MPWLKILQHLILLLKINEYTFTFLILHLSYRLTLTKMKMQKNNSTINKTINHLIDYAKQSNNTQVAQGPYLQR